MYCLSCRAQATLTNLVESFISKNGRRMERSMCGKCGRVITTFCRRPATSLSASYDSVSGSSDGQQQQPSASTSAKTSPYCSPEKTATAAQQQE